MSTYLMDCVYLDNNATTRPFKEVRMAMLEALEFSYGNASSAHSLGHRSRNNITAARDSLAKLIGAHPEQIIFTSGGTEANNQVILSVASAVQKSMHIITSTVEHSSILNTCKHLQETKGAQVTYLQVDSNGIIDIEEFKRAFNEQTSLVSIQWINNETGVIQNIKSIGLICRDQGVTFHTDAAQAVGKIPMDVSSLPIDFVTCTAHKIHGPQGVGAIYAKDPTRLKHLLFGGPQELELRSGTENLIGIVGFGVAASMRNKNLTENISYMCQIRNLLEGNIKKAIPLIKINGGNAERVCNTSNILFPDIEGFSLVAQLDRLGIQCSQSSACTNQRPEPSYVLRAMGLTEDEAFASIRFCVSSETMENEIEKAVECIIQCWHNLALRA
ncbi:MAG: cysteine desulfurase family protein [Smithellaceae bacterium]